MLSRCSIDLPIHSAIAKEVFGLEQTILWNHGSSSLASPSGPNRSFAHASLLRPDLFDWCLLDDGTTTCTTQGPADDAALDAEINAVLSGPKSPGVVSLSLSALLASARFEADLECDGYSSSSSTNAPTALSRDLLAITLTSSRMGGMHGQSRFFSCLSRSLADPDDDDAEVQSPTSGVSTGMHLFLFSLYPASPLTSAPNRYQNTPRPSSRSNPSISIGAGPLSSNVNVNRIPTPTSRAPGANSAVAPTPTEVLTLAAPVSVTSVADDTTAR